MSIKRWLLPEGVEEVLAPASWRLEALRAQLLSLYRTWGYELILPPLI
jgi:ATP phosphoribosyltransferase regulatory subunit